MCEPDFLHQGVGTHKERAPFLRARPAGCGIEKCNLVSVSSILPPGAGHSPERGLQLLIPGGITYCVLARCSSNEPRRLLAASIGCAIPSNRALYGYLSEHHAFGRMKGVRDYAEDLRRPCWLPPWNRI